MKLVQIDKSGNIIEFFDSENSSNIPKGCIELTIEKWEDLQVNPNQRYFRKRWKLIELTPVLKIVPEIIEINWPELKNLRITQLQNSDWSQIDSSVTQEKREDWEVWRNKVRNLPQHFPEYGNAKKEFDRLMIDKP